MMKTVEMNSMCCNTISTSNVTFLFWKCSSCKNVEESTCSECGNKKFRCNKMGVIVKEDFFCKDWESKPNFEYVPYIPSETYPTYTPTWIYTAPTTGGSTKR